MGTVIHYSSGHDIELREGEGQRFWNRARNAGFRYYQSLDNIIIPFNHPTITYIELEAKKEEPKPVVPKKEAAEAKPEKKKTMTEIKEKELTNQAKQEADFMAKANCIHKDGNGVTLRKLYFTETVNGRKYFPVCEFCGHRERYVGVPKIEAGENALWTMEDVRSAKPYEAV